MESPPRLYDTLVNVLSQHANWVDRRHLKTLAEKEAGAKLSRVVLGRPVFFVDDDPERDAKAQAALEQAARAVGFTQVHFQYEPIAAALDYETSIDREQVVLVVDGSIEGTVLKSDDGLQVYVQGDRARIAKVLSTHKLYDDKPTVLERTDWTPEQFERELIASQARQADDP